MCCFVGSLYRSGVPNVSLERCNFVHYGEAILPRSLKKPTSGLFGRTAGDGRSLRQQAP